MFTFDPKKHIYTLDGVEIPSVTSVLPYNFHGNATDWHKDKGHYVHEMVRLYNLNDLDEDTLDSQLTPYLDAYKKFRENYHGEGIVDVKSGMPQPADELQLAGYSLLVNEGWTEKGGTISIPAYEQILYHPIYQFAGTPDIVTGTKNAYAVYLNDNGTFRMVDHTKDLRRNIQIFLSFLTCHKWRKERGLK